MQEGKKLAPEVVLPMPDVSSVWLRLTLVCAGVMTIFAVSLRAMLHYQSSHYDPTSETIVIEQQRTLDTCDQPAKKPATLRRQ